MKQRPKTVAVGNLLHVCAPLALYYLLSSLAASIYMQFLMFEAGFAVLGSESADVQEYILREYPGRVLQMVLLTALIAVPVFGWMYCRDLKERKGFSFCHMVIVLELRPVSWAALGSMALALALNLILLSSPLPGWSAGFRQAQEAMYQGSIWMELAASGAAAAVMEELLFRGLLYGRMRELLGAGSAVLWSALAFGVCHGNLVQGVYGFLMGCFLAYLMERFGTVLIPILAHMSANVFLIFLTEGGGLDGLLQKPLVWAGTAAACMVLFAFSMALIWASGKAISGEKQEEN